MSTISTLQDSQRGAIQSLQGFEESIKNVIELETAWEQSKKNLPSELEKVSSFVRKHLEELSVYNPFQEKHSFPLDEKLHFLISKWEKRQISLPKLLEYTQLFRQVLQKGDPLPLFPEELEEMEKGKDIESLQRILQDKRLPLELRYLAEKAVLRISLKELKEKVIHLEERERQYSFFLEGESPFVTSDKEGRVFLPSDLGTMGPVGAGWIGYLEGRESYLDTKDSPFFLLPPHFSSSEKEQKMEKKDFSPHSGKEEKMISSSLEEKDASSSPIEPKEPRAFSTKRRNKRFDFSESSFSKRKDPVKKNLKIKVDEPQLKKRKAKRKDEV